MKEQSKDPDSSVMLTTTSDGASNICTSSSSKWMTPLKPAAAATSLSVDVSPSELSSSSSPFAVDTPVAVDPYTPPPHHHNHPHNNHSQEDEESVVFRKVYLEGIPELLQQQQQQPPSSSMLHEPLPQPPAGYDDASFDSLLSSIDEDVVAVEGDNDDDDDDNESYYFTPLEERPSNKMERLRRELQLRSELLHYLSEGQPTSYVRQLQQQEETVQRWTLSCAQKKYEDRERRKAERRRKRQQQQQQEGTTCSHSSTSANNSNNNSPNNANNSSSYRHSALDPEDDPILSAVSPKHLKSLFDTMSPTSQRQEQDPQPNNDLPTESPSQQSTATTTTSSDSANDHDHSCLYPLSWSHYVDFEWYHGIPALASLILACIGHAALYELILALVLVGMQPFLSYRILTDNQDRILEASPESERVEDACYAVVFVVGIVLARVSGLLFTFSRKRHHNDTDSSCSSTMTTNPKERHLDPNRIDRLWAQWMYYNKWGKMVKGMLDILSFYLCFVAVMYFMGRFALCIDQRASILQDMPSNRQFQTTTTTTTTTELLSSVVAANNQNTMTRGSSVAGVDLRTCPADVDDILLPSMRSETSRDSSDSSSSSSSNSSSDSDDEDESEEHSFIVEFGLPDCDSDDDDDDDDDDEEDEFGNTIIYESGPEDEEFLYRHLSVSAYQQFWGYGYRGALFDLPHQLFFNLACSVVAIYTLKRYFGCSFWEDW